MVIKKHKYIKENVSFDSKFYHLKHGLFGDKIFQYHGGNLDPTFCVCYCYKSRNEKTKTYQNSNTMVNSFQQKYEKLAAQKVIVTPIGFMQESRNSI